MRRLAVLSAVALLFAVPVAAATVPISLSVSDPGQTTAGDAVEVTLTVTNDGDQPSDAMGVQVEDLPDQLTVVEIRSPNGSVAENRNAVFWTEPVPSGETVTATYVIAVDDDASADAYEFTARAASGDTEVRDRVTVDVVPPNQGPNAVVGAPGDATVGAAVTLDASGSADPDGTIASYEWDLDGDGEYEVTGETVDHTFETTGDRTVTLRVTDDDGATATATTQVAVSERSGDPTDGERTNASTDDATESAIPWETVGPIAAVAGAALVAGLLWYVRRDDGDAAGATPGESDAAGPADGADRDTTGTHPAADPGRTPSEGGTESASEPNGEREPARSSGTGGRAVPPQSAPTDRPEPKDGEPDGSDSSAPEYCPHCGAAVAAYDLPTLEFCPDCGGELAGY